jgi:hypothetical protein
MTGAGWQIGRRSVSRMRQASASIVKPLVPSAPRLPSNRGHPACSWEGAETETPVLFNPPVAVSSQKPLSDAMTAAPGSVNCGATIVIPRSGHVSTHLRLGSSCSTRDVISLILFHCFAGIGLSGFQLNDLILISLKTNIPKEESQRCNCKPYKY